MKLEKILTYCLFAFFFMALGFVGGQKVQQHWDEKKMVVDYDDCKPLDEAYQDLILVIYHNQPDIIEDWLCETNEWEYLSQFNDDWVYLKESLEDFNNEK